MTVRAAMWAGVAVLAAACSGGGGGGGGGGGNETPLTAPTNLSYPIDVAIHTMSVAIAPNAPTVDGEEITFHVNPALPDGLALDADSGVISGVPAVTAARATYTVSAANAAGAVEVELTLTIVPPVRFAYAVSHEDSTISIFSVDTSNGRLQRKGYVLADFDELGPESITVHPSGRFAYVPNELTSNISIYEIDAASGWLHARGAVATGAGPHDVALDPSGRFLYVACQTADQIWVYAVHEGTGGLAPVVWPYPSGVQPSAIAVDPRGRFLFVTWYGSAIPFGNGSDYAGVSAVQAYHIDPLTGSISPAGTPKLLNGTHPIDVIVDPYQDVVYVTLELMDSVLPLRFHPTSGALTYVTTDPTGDRPVAINVHPSGRFAYTANDLGGTLTCLGIDPKTGDLSLLSTVPAGDNPACVTIDPSGRFLYVANRHSNDVLQYAINSATGALKLTDVFQTRNGPAFVALAPGTHAATWVPRFVHVANSESDDVSSFTIDRDTGALSEVGLAALAGDRPVSIAIDPRARHAYVANGGSGTLSTFAIHAETGALTESAAAVPLSGQPTHVVVDPSGRFLYAVARNAIAGANGYLTTFVIDAPSGSLSPVITQPVGPNPTWVACDPTGRFLYCANGGIDASTSSISVFRLSLVNGVPQVSASPSVAPGIFGLGFHPSGKYAYGTLQSTSLFVQFAIDGVNGGLTMLPGVASAGLLPTAIALTPDGRFCHVSYAQQGGGHVASFAIDALGAPIMPAALTSDGLEPVDLKVDPSGRFLYVANAGSNDVSILAIDSATGALALRGSVASGLVPAALAVTSVTE